MREALAVVFGALGFEAVATDEGLGGLLRHPAQAVQLLGLRVRHRLRFVLLALRPLLLLH